MTRYVLHPGWVESRHDGQEHYIGLSNLAALYGVPLRDCVDARALQFKPPARAM